MILRTLKLVHFRGIAEFAVRDLPARGLARVVLPADAPRDLVRDAVAFLFVGPDLERAEEICGDAGFTFVEAGLETGDGGALSLFRGLDRAGTMQVSLRPADGAVIGDPGDVAKRLEELLGGPPESWLENAVLKVRERRVVEVEAVDPEPSEPAIDREGLLHRVEDAAVGLRRACHAAHLLRKAQDRLDALLAYGGRLRHERKRTALDLDHHTSERDRLRTRLRRLAEYHEQVAKARASRPAERSSAPAPWPSAEIGLALLSAGFLVLLLWLFLSREPALEGVELRLAASIGLVASFSGFMVVTGRRRAEGAGVREATSRAHEEWREALRHRFHDLEDPDDASLASDLRARTSSLDAEIAPCQNRLERLDEAIAVHDVEIGRACRALHRPIPEPVEAASGFGAGEGLDRAEATISELGDAVYQAIVEREALVAGGAAKVEEAIRHAREEVAAVGQALGVADAARVGLAALGWEQLEAVSDERLVSAGRRLESDLDSLGRSLVDRARALPAAAAGASVPKMVARSLLGSTAQDTVESVERALRDGVGVLTGGQWTELTGDQGRLCLNGPMGRVPLDALPEPVRARLAYGLRRLVESAEGRAVEGLRLVDGVPNGFTGVEDLAAYLAAILPGDVQVVSVEVAEPAPEPTRIPEGLPASGPLPPGR